MDYALRLVTLAGNPVALTAIEYRMLVELSANAGLPLTHQHLLQRVWGPDKGENSGPVRDIVQEAAAQAGRRPGRSQLHLRLAHRGVPHGGGRDAGRGVIAASCPAAGTWRLPQVGPEGYRTQGKLGFRSKQEMVVWAVRNSLLDDELPPWVSRAGKAAGARQTGGVNESGVKGGGKLGQRGGEKLYHLA